METITDAVENISSKDEEILFSYGPSYWAGFSRTGSREIETTDSQAIVRNYWHENDKVIQMVCRSISEYNEDLSQTISIASMANLMTSQQYQ